MSQHPLTYETKDQVAYLTLNRPEAGNAVNQRLAWELADACDRINQDGDVRVALLSGAGDAFCLGADPAEPPRQAAVFLAGVARPVIACLNGDATGQGLELALACDIRLAVEGCRLAMSQLETGQVPWDGGTQRLARLVGRGKALEMLLTASAVDAAEALRIGLVGKVLPSGSLFSQAEALARRMASMAPYSLRFAKEAINKGMDLTLEQGLRLEADLYFLMHTTRDRVEGITCFLQKKTPRFEGR